MKNLKLVLCALAVMMLMAFSACGGKTGTDTPDTTADAAVQSSEDDTQAAANDDEDGDDLYDDLEGDDDSAVTGKYASVKEYAESDEVKSMVESMQESMNNMGMNMSITGEDNKFIYTYTYLEIEKTDGMAEALESGMEAQADTFKSLVGTLKMIVDEENPVVVVRYVDVNGEEIYSAEFEAE